MTKYVALQGWWAAGRFWQPIYEVRADGHWATPYLLDATYSGAALARKTMLEQAGELGLETAAALAGFAKQLVTMPEYDRITA